jgi:hypothetical protein
MLCVIECDLKKLVNEEALALWGLSRQYKEKGKLITQYDFYKIN